VVEPSPDAQQNEVVHSHALLHYSVLKNLAELAEKENDIDLALEYYMEVLEAAIIQFVLLVIYWSFLIASTTTPFSSHFSR